MDIDNNNKLERAKKRVGEIKGFYIHLAVYIVINSFILVNIYIRTMAEGESFWQFPTFFTLIFWGIGLAFHYLIIFTADTRRHLLTVVPGRPSRLRSKQASPGINNRVVFFMITEYLKTVHGRTLNP